LGSGLILLTNNKEFSKVLDSSLNALERVTYVRFYGRMFNEKVLQALRTGFTISGTKYGPYLVFYIMESRKV